MSLRSALFFSASLLLSAAGVHAEPLASAAPDPVLEKHVLDLTQQLRCLVCQNETIADSQAQLALDLKKQVREQLARGASDKEVVAFMVQRYGDFVLYRPPVKGITWLLWFGPFLLLLTGLLLLLRTLRRRLPPAELTVGDHARASALLAQSSALKELP